MFKLDPNTTVSFQKVTGYDVNAYLTAYSEFKRQFYPKIIDFYNGSVTDANRVAFDVLAKLKDEANTINNVVYQFRESFKSINDWYLIELLEDLRIQIWTTEKMGKYSRSSITSSNYNPSPEFIHVLGDYQTLEDINEDILKSKNPNQWVDIAMRNDLSEADYNVDEGGNQLIISKPKDINNFYLKGVVDNLFGERLYGKDFNKSVSFVLQDDGSYDFDILGYKETFKQSALILGCLKKRDIPEFPFLGLEDGIGMNVFAFTYRSVIRQLTEVFRTDDTIVDFIIKKFSYENGNVYIEFEVNSFYNLVQQDKIEL
jgi:hypothetical protein